VRLPTDRPRPAQNARALRRFRRNLRITGRESIERAAQKIAEVKIGIAKRAHRHRIATGWLMLAAVTVLIAVRCAL
jgi:hypothetical protein